MTFRVLTHFGSMEFFLQNLSSLPLPPDPPELSVFLQYNLPRASTLLLPLRWVFTGLPEPFLSYFQLLYYHFTHFPWSSQLQSSVSARFSFGQPFIQTYAHNILWGQLLTPCSSSPNMAMKTAIISYKAAISRRR